MQDLAFPPCSASVTPISSLRSQLAPGRPQEIRESQVRCIMLDKLPAAADPSCA